MRITQLKERLGKTLTELSEMTGLSPQNLSQYLTGKRGKKSEVVEKVAKELGLSVEEVIFKTDYRETDPGYWYDLSAEAKRIAKQLEV